MTYRGSQWGKDARVDEVNRNLLEQENDRKLEELGAQVLILKDITLGLNQEVKSQNKMLDGMGDTFLSASGLLSSTIGKIGNMITSGSSNYMYLLVTFIVFVFLVIYFMMGRK